MNAGALPARLSPPKELLGTATFRGVLLLALADWACIAACWVLMVAAWRASAAIGAGAIEGVGAAGTVAPPSTTVAPAHATALISAAWTCVWVGLIVIAGGRFHALGVLAHDAIHSPWRTSRAALFVLGPLTGFPTGTTLEAMRYHHLRHHRNNGLEGSDPYFTASLANAPARRAVSLIYVSLLPLFWSLRPWFGVVAWAVPSLRTAYARLFLQDVSGRDLRDHPEVGECLRAEPWLIAWQLAVVAVGVLVSWTAVLFGLVLPVAVAGIFNARRLMLEHTYTAAADRSLAAILSTTRDHGVGAFAQVIAAPHFIGYHVVHHLHPQVAFSQLPALRAWYRDRLGPAYLPPEPPARLF